MTEETRRWKKKSSEPISNWPFVRESCEWEEVIGSVPRETVAGAGRFGSTGHDYLRERMLNFKQRRGASFSRSCLRRERGKQRVSPSLSLRRMSRIGPLAKTLGRVSSEQTRESRRNKNKGRKRGGRKGNKRSGGRNREGEAVIYSINRA